MAWSSLKRKLQGRNSIVIDLHSHILPNVDDGAQSLLEALDMLRMSIDGGVTTQVLTPHIHFGRFDNMKDDLQAKFEQFKAEVDAANIKVNLRLSAEVRIGSEVMQLVQQSAIPWLGSYNNQNVFLLEFPRQEVPFGSDNMVKWLLAQNCLPIIVHPERNRTFVHQRHKLETFIELGCPLQVTASSLTGRFGEDAQAMAYELLESGEAQLIASDCHNLKGRAPDLGEVVKTLSEDVRGRFEEFSAELINAE